MTSSYLLNVAHFNHTSENRSRSTELNKAPEADNIPAELLKYAGNKVLNAIYNLITLILEQEQIPNEWKKSIICPFHKKGDKLSCEN
jgi:hypothetical protein